MSTPWGCLETQGEDDASKCMTVIWIRGRRAGPTGVVGVWQMMELVSLFVDLLTAAAWLRQLQTWPQAHGERAWVGFVAVAPAWPWAACGSHLR